MSRLAKIFGIASVVLFLARFLAGGCQKLYSLNKVSDIVNYNNPIEIFMLDGILPYMAFAQLLGCLCLVIFFFLARKSAREPKTKAIVYCLGAIGLPMLLIVLWDLCLLISNTVVYFGMSHKLYMNVVSVAHYMGILWIVPFTIVAIWALASLKPKNQPGK